MFCLLLTDISEPGRLIEEVHGVAKEVVTLLTFSEGLVTVAETAMWELQSTFFSLGPGLSFLKPCLSLKNVGKHKDPELLHFIRSLTVWIWYPYNVPWKLCWQSRSKKIHLLFYFNLTNSLKYLWKEFAHWVVFSVSWLPICVHVHGAWKIFCSSFDPMVQEILPNFFCWFY